MVGYSSVIWAKCATVCFRLIEFGTGSLPISDMFSILRFFYFCYIARSGKEERTSILMCDLFPFSTAF